MNVASADVDPPVECVRQPQPDESAGGSLSTELVPAIAVALPPFVLPLVVPPGFGVDPPAPIEEPPLVTLPPLVLPPRVLPPDAGAPPAPPLAAPPLVLPLLPPLPPAPPLGWSALPGPVNCHESKLNRLPLPPVIFMNRSWTPIAPVTGHVFVVHIWGPPVPVTAQLLMSAPV